MNARVVVVIAGMVTVTMGVAGLIVPRLVMAHLLGFMVDPAYSTNAVLGEVRATYGGLFVVLGAYTLLASLDPSAHRSPLMFIGLLWLGACAGRLVGVNVDGNPGLWGWVAGGMELVFGGSLVTASLTARPEAPVLPLPAPAPQPISSATAPPASPTPTTQQ